MRLAIELANGNDSPLPLGKASEHIYADALEKQPKYARKDFSSMYDYLRSSS
jgi:3-hydroxyisobutyrate dehydrogenase-like beta-hydroxyacid dehydrogenase